MKRPQIFGVHAVPSTRLSIILGLIPFIIVLITYAYFSHIRHLENDADKILPTLAQISSAVDRMAFTEDRRTGEYLLLTDTVSSLGRIFAGVGLATVVALFLGLNIGLFKGLRSIVNPFLTFISMIPPLSILPILFIAFGIDEFGKIALIFLGTFPLITRDVNLYASSLPKEMIIKAKTLGASDLTLTYKVILPLVIPRLVDTVRLSLGGAWLFLIAAEAIASSNGLGYRIFLMRRYLNMDVIIPYVIWITIIGVTIDFLLKFIVKKAYPWYSNNTL